MICPGCDRWRKSAASALVLLAAWVVTACPPAPRPPDPPASATASAAAAEPIGPRPELAAPTPYRAPKPQIFRAAGGLTVWLVERRGLPLVSLCLAIPYGSAEDP
ncbi:MAG: hypothetical protein JRI23_24615, partial [Deltaproteobacteria bacterium]|nr:hypothetical protein [Deltaproteobacteria bacterium]